MCPELRAVARIASNSCQHAWEAGLVVLAVKGLAFQPRRLRRGESVWP